MTSQDRDKAASRFISAVVHIQRGFHLQRERVLDNAASAPRLLEGTPEEFVHLTGVPENDLDYYAYELGRLRATTGEVIKAFDRPAEIVTALEAFDQAVPRLREARNSLTHPSDDPRLDDVGWFSALVRHRSDGSVDYLVDPRYGHHDAADALADALLRFLRARLRDTP